MMNSRLQRFFSFLLRPGVRYGLAWLVAVTAALSVLAVAWTSFNSPRLPDGTLRRPGGNFGHTTIDFGGQWLMGRIVVKGWGTHLYHHSWLKEIAKESYPREDEVRPENRDKDEADAHDAENLVSWLVDVKNPAASQALASFLAPLAADDCVSLLGYQRAEMENAERRCQAATAPMVTGALYPPIQALFMAPIAYFEPNTGYRVAQLTGWILGFLSAWGLSLLSGRRLWWPVAIAYVVLFPCFGSALNLGQNSPLLLAILIWGWVMIARGRPVTGGIIWGLFAFKPIWGLAFFLVPLLTGRWRVCLAMIVTGVALAAVTLPVVGWYAWIEWLQVGAEASRTYAVDANWVHLSRDLLNVPARWFLDFELPHAERSSRVGTLVGWALLIGVVGSTMALASRRKDRFGVVYGPAAAFLFFAGWLSCYHFMYYDVLLTALPVMLLLFNLRCYLEPVYISLARLPSTAIDGALVAYYEPRPAASYPSGAVASSANLRTLGRLNSMTLSLVALLLLTEYTFPGMNIALSASIPALDGGPLPMPLRFSTSLKGSPYTTFCILALWAWSGLLWLRMPNKLHGAPTAQDARQAESAENESRASAQFV